MSQPRNLQREFFDMLMESQYWLPETMLAYQRSQLSQLLRHARANVPFYEHRLDAVFTAGGDINWDRWSEIPIVKRSDLFERRHEMLAKELPKGHGAIGTISSSGSTGLPIQVTRNRLTAIAANANRWRTHRWHHLDWSRTYTGRDRLDPEADWPHGRPMGPWGPPGDAAAAAGRCFLLSRRATAEQTLEFLDRTGSSYFSSGPKTLHAMGLESERLGLGVRLDCVMTQGEPVEEEDRRVIKRAFGARTLEQYGSKEGGQIATPCPDGGGGMHINAESVLVEIIDAQGHACPPGQPGRVIITPFVSTAQPLIRYDQGDIARLGVACRCGRCLPVLEAIDGRAMAMFTHPDGRTVARLLTEGARAALNCSFWQIAQVGPLDFEVRYVLRDKSRAADEAAAADIFRGIYFSDARVRFVARDSIPLTAAGKHIEYVNEWTTR